MIRRALAMLLVARLVDAACDEDLTAIREFRGDAPHVTPVVDGDASDIFARLNEMYETVFSLDEVRELVERVCARRLVIFADVDSLERFSPLISDTQLSELDLENAVLLTFFLVEKHIQ